MIRYLILMAVALSPAFASAQVDVIAKMTGVPYYQGIPTQAPIGTRNPSTVWVLDSNAWYHYDYDILTWVKSVPGHVGGEPGLGEPAVQAIVSDSVSVERSARIAAINAIVPNNLGVADQSLTGNRTIEGNNFITTINNSILDIKSDGIPAAKMTQLLDTGPTGPGPAVSMSKPGQNWNFGLANGGFGISDVDATVEAINITPGDTDPVIFGKAVSMSDNKVIDLATPTTLTDAARLQEIVGTHTSVEDAVLILSDFTPKQHVTLAVSSTTTADTDATVPPPLSTRAGHTIIVTSVRGGDGGSNTFSNRIVSTGTDIRLPSGTDVNAIVIPYDRTYTVTCKDVGAGIYRWILDVGDDPSAFTGWAQYLDTEYTSGSPFLLVADVERTLPNNAGTIIDDQIPIDITTFYIVGDSTITGRENDDIEVLIEFKAVPTSVSATYLDLATDIGGVPGKIYGDTRNFPKGVGEVRNMIYQYSGFTLDTWAANGGKIRVSSNGPVSIYGIRYVIKRHHKAR